MLYYRRMKEWLIIVYNTYFYYLYRAHFARSVSPHSSSRPNSRNVGTILAPSPVTVVTSPKLFKSSKTIHLCLRILQVQKTHSIYKYWSDIYFEYSVCFGFGEPVVFFGDSKFAQRNSWKNGVDFWPYAIDWMLRTRSNKV